MDLPCVYVDLYEKTSPCAYTPWMYYSHREPADSDRPLFWLDLEASPHWSFRAGDIRRGQIYNEDELLANVYFREPYEDQCIDRIEWIKNKEVYVVDHYDISGCKYAETIVDGDSGNIVKYCDRKGTVTVAEWTAPGFVLVKKEQQEVYAGSDQFYTAFMKDFLSDHEEDMVFFYEPELLKFIPENCRRVLFVTDQVPEELKDKKYRDLLSLIVTGTPGMTGSIRQFHAEGEIPGIIEIGRLIDRSAEHPVGDALIVTRSQHIEHLEALVKGLPELHFHIAAGTTMAPGLMEFGKYDNVSLYPNSSRSKIMTLMGQCAFYLDINHYLEYDGIVHAAQKMDRLVYAFDNTIHQRASIPKEHIYAPEEEDRMIADISRAMFDPYWLQESLEIQRKMIEITAGQKKEFKEYILKESDYCLQSIDNL